MFKACVQFVNSLGKAGRETVGDRPQPATLHTSLAKTTMDKLVVLPQLIATLPQHFPQPKLAISSLLQSYFSLFSTPPTTITTT